MTQRQDLRRRANAVARTILAPLPLAFWRGSFPKDLVALCYHVASDADLPHLRFYPYKNARQFEDDVIFARRRAITYRRLAEHRLHGAPLPKNSMLFTFDDGFAECHDVIAPILQRHGVDGVFFVTTSYLEEGEAFFECTLSLCVTEATRIPLERAEMILAEARIDDAALRGNATRYNRAQRRLHALRIAPSDAPARRTLLRWILGLEEIDRSEIARVCAALHVDAAAYVAKRPIFMTRAQVRALAAAGFTVGAHGLRHRLLEGRDPEAIEREIVASCDVVRDLTGAERVPFAFPYSGIAIDREVIAGILRRNPQVELIFDSGALRRDPTFIVNRVFADTPPTAGSTNVPQALREAWSVPSAWFRAR